MGWKVRFQAWNIQYSMHAHICWLFASDLAAARTRECAKLTVLPAPATSRTSAQFPSSRRWEMSPKRFPFHFVLAQFIKTILQKQRWYFSGKLWTTPSRCVWRILLKALMQSNRIWVRRLWRSKHKMYSSVWRIPLWWKHVLTPFFIA